MPFLLLKQHCLILFHFLSLGRHGAMVLCQILGVFLVGRFGKDGFLPQVRSQVGVCLGNGSVGGLSEVAQGASGSSSRSVTVLDTSHLQKLLGNRSGHNTGTSGSRDESHPDGTTLASHLARNGVRSSNLVTPETTTNGDNRQLGQDDGATDGGGNLLGAFDAQTNVTVTVSDSHEGLETGTLTGAGLLLDRHDLQDLVLQGGEKHVDDLMFLDWEREQVDLFEALDLSILDQTTEFGHRDPILFRFFATASAASTTTATSTAASASAATASKAASESSTIGWCLV